MGENEYRWYRVWDGGRWRNQTAWEWIGGAAELTVGVLAILIVAFSCGIQNGVFP